MLYVRFGADQNCYWRWLGEYLDDLEEFAPGIQAMHQTTVGDFARKLLTVGERDLFGRRADVSLANRGDAGDVDSPWRGVAATPRPRRG